jgi:starch synthase
VKVGFLTAELAPVAHVGGLGDVSRWLPETLAAGGDDVAVFLPRYDVIDPDHIVEIGAVEVGAHGSVTLATLGVPSPGRTTTYLIGHELFQTGSIYGSGPDEHLRFGLFTSAVPAVCGSLGWVPDVFHANDWHTALLPAVAASAGPPWDATPVVLTIHNLAFQGVFPGSDLDRMGLAGAIDRTDRVSSLAAGIRGASMITTVSPTYATEIVTPERGEGLHDVLGVRRDALIGILNGVGPDWDPATDAHIPAPFDQPSGKAPNTAALRNRMGLETTDAPILGVVSRLTNQKGFGMMNDVVAPLLEQGTAQLAAVGTGDPAIEEVFDGLAADYPGRAGFHRGFDTALGHLIEAGSDMFLMPSQFEPCGLNQMYSMRYGTPPVVHRTGGLTDTVEPWDPEQRTGTGFLFDEFTADAFAGALTKALEAFGDPVGWRVLMENGMARDFTWGARAEEYRGVYRMAIESMRRGGQGR